MHRQPLSDTRSCQAPIGLILFLCFSLSSSEDPLCSALSLSCYLSISLSVCLSACLSPSLLISLWSASKKALWSSHCISFYEDFQDFYATKVNSSRKKWIFRMIKLNCNSKSRLIWHSTRACFISPGSLRACVLVHRSKRCLHDSSPRVCGIGLFLRSAQGWECRHDSHQHLDGQLALTLHFLIHSFISFCRDPCFGG